jgi:hypothetical protein
MKLYILICLIYNLFVKFSCMDYVLYSVIHTHILYDGINHILDYTVYLFRHVFLSLLLKRRDRFWFSMYSSV